MTAPGERQSDEDYVAEWFIPEALRGGTYCLEVGPDGEPDPEELLGAIAVVVDAAYLEECVIEYRRMGSGEPWRRVSFDDADADADRGLMQRAIGVLEHLLERGAQPTEQDRQRIFSLLDRGGVG